MLIPFYNISIFISSDLTEYIEKFACSAALLVVVAVAVIYGVLV